MEIVKYCTSHLVYKRPSQLTSSSPPFRGTKPLALRWDKAGGHSGEETDEKQTSPQSVTAG